MNLYAFMEHTYLAKIAFKTGTVAVALVWFVTYATVLTWFVTHD